MTDREMKTYMTKPPYLCPECAVDVARLIAENTDLDQLYHHCPHSDTLVHMRIEQHEGRPAIVQWVLQGPVPQAEACRIIETLGQSLDA
jgi:hypothetical protein